MTDTLRERATLSDEEIRRLIIVRHCSPETTFVPIGHKERDIADAARDRAIEVCERKWTLPIPCSADPTPGGAYGIVLKHWPDCAGKCGGAGYRVLGAADVLRILQSAAAEPTRPAWIEDIKSMLAALAERKKAQSGAP